MCWISHLWYDLWMKIIQWADSLEKNLMLGKIESRRRRGQQRTRWLDGIINSMDMNLSKLLGIEKDQKAWHAAIHGFRKSWIQLSDWTTIFLLESESVVTHSCLPLCDPMHCSLPGSSVHGILQAGILEWVAIPFSRRPSQPRDQT